MHKTRLIFVLILFINFTIYSQSEENQVISTDSISDLSKTDDVLDLFSISLSDDELNDDTSAFVLLDEIEKAHPSSVIE